MAMPSITILTSAAMLVLLLMTSALALPTRGEETAGHAAQGVLSGAANLDMWVPVGPVEHRLAAAAAAVVAGSPSGRSSDAQPFQVCQQCRCCQGGDPAKCAMMPCCFGINCNVPGKPSGQCSFVPKACNCNNCS